MNVTELSCLRLLVVLRLLHNEIRSHVRAFCWVHTYHSYRHSLFRIKVHPFQYSFRLLIIGEAILALMHRSACFSIHRMKFVISYAQKKLHLLFVRSCISYIFLFNEMFQKCAKSFSNQVSGVFNWCWFNPYEFWLRSFLFLTRPLQIIAKEQLNWRKIHHYIQIVNWITYIWINQLLTLSNSNCMLLHMLMSTNDPSSVHLYEVCLWKV